MLFYAFPDGSCEDNYHCVVPVKHLPPIELSAVLVADYPSVSPPQFSLSCAWLSIEMVSLCVFFSFYALIEILVKFINLKMVLQFFKDRSTIIISAVKKLSPKENCLSQISHHVDCFFGLIPCT